MFQLCDSFRVCIYCPSNDVSTQIVNTFLAGTQGPAMGPQQDVPLSLSDEVSLLVGMSVMTLVLAFPPLVIALKKLFWHYTGFSHKYMVFLNHLPWKEKTTCR